MAGLHAQLEQARTLLDDEASDEKGAGDAA